MKKLLFIMFFLASLANAANFEFSHIPIQENGRIKPIDTFAKNQLLSIYTKRSIKSENLSAIGWLLNTLSNPKDGFNKPIFKIKNPEVVRSIGLDWDNQHTYSYHQVLSGLSNQKELLTELNSKEDKDLSLVERQLRDLNFTFEKFANMWWYLKIIPPESSDPNLQWLSPWEIQSYDSLNKNQLAIMYNFLEFLNSYSDDNQEGMVGALEKYEFELSNNFSYIDLNRLKIETTYNNWNLFYVSIAFYILSFFLLCLSWIVFADRLYLFSALSLIVGFISHTAGICLRMYIMQRPPVSTLYESIIFVGFITVLGSLIVEKFRKNGLGIFVATVVGIILHFVSFSYANDGETLGMLVAVLNSNFWLATHVTTITTGYGISLIAGLMGHVYLIYSIIKPKDTKVLKDIYNNSFGITLVALFFTLFGTILGGIWADQSWGRFWGWDPKENGAMLICMWHLMMIHLRLTGLVKARGYALGISFVNIIVVLAWFGVNLLSVGLHSYGFATGIAMNITIFTIFEIVLLFGLFFASKKLS